MQEAGTGPILNYVEAGQDVRIMGDAASAQLDVVAAKLGATCNVIRLTAPQGGLSLSMMIGQLSGRDNFDDQDDGALELAFRRLCGTDGDARPIVLLLEAGHGVQRPVLRYLQQVKRNAPRLLFVITDFPELGAFLAAPDMARLRARLQDVVLADAPERTEIAPIPLLIEAPVPMLQIPPDWTVDVRRPDPAPRRRLGLLWTASGLALVASAALGFWLGQARTADPGRRIVEATTWAAPLATPGALPVELRADTRLQPVPAQLAAPTLAARVEPAPAARAPSAPEAAVPGNLAAVPPPVLAKSAAPAPAASAEPPAALAARAELGVVASELSLAIPTAHTRPAETQRLPRPRAVARTRPQAEPPYGEDERSVPYYDADDLPPPGRPRATRRGREPAAYDPYGPAPAGPYGGPASSGTRYEPPANEDYIGTFSTGPYGARVFRYGP